MVAPKRKHGGARPGAGRPRGSGKKKRKAAPAAPPEQLSIDLGKELPWHLIRQAAEAGAPESTILDAYAIAPSRLEVPAIKERFHRELREGHAVYELQLRLDIKWRGKHTRRNAGSVNALQLQARNVLGWDRGIEGQEQAPDLGTARQRLRDLLAKLEKSRSEIEGRPVTMLELLQRVALEGAGAGGEP